MSLFGGVPLALNPTAVQQGIVSGEVLSGSAVQDESRSPAFQ